MARFQVVHDNSRGGACKASSPTMAAVNGWNGGILVRPRRDGDDDVFDVVTTGGTNAIGAEHHVGTLRVTGRSREWTATPQDGDPYDPHRATAYRLVHDALVQAERVAYSRDGHVSRDCPGPDGDSTKLCALCSCIHLLRQSIALHSKEPS